MDPGSLPRRSWCETPRTPSDRDPPCAAAGDRARRRAGRGGRTLGRAADPADRRDPHGVAFTELNPSHKTVLREFLHALALATHAASRLPLALPVQFQVKARPGRRSPGRPSTWGGGASRRSSPLLWRWGRRSPSPSPPPAHGRGRHRLGGGGRAPPARRPHHPRPPVHRARLGARPDPRRPPDGASVGATPLAGVQRTPCPFTYSW